MAQSKVPTNYLGYLLSKTPNTGKISAWEPKQKVISFFFRLQWVAHLEFSHNTEVSDLTWDTVEERLPRTDRLRAMVKLGVPHSLRPQLWMRMSGAFDSIRSQRLFFNVYLFLIRCPPEEIVVRDQLQGCGEGLEQWCADDVQANWERPASNFAQQCVFQQERQHRHR